MTVVGHLPDQELIIHIAAPLDGPHAARVRADIGRLWARCRRLLGTGDPISHTGLPTGLPPGPIVPVPSVAEQGIAAAQDHEGDFQLIARRLHNVLCVSLVFFTPPPDRRIRVGSAAPPGWVEFDRWWREVAADTTGSCYGVLRVFQAQRGDAFPVDASPGGSLPAVRAALPQDVRISMPRDAEQISPDGFVLWDPATNAADDPERALVVVCPDGDDTPLSTWTWSDGGIALPPLARYFLHTAQIRYEMRVWHSEGPELENLRHRVEARVARLRHAPEESAEILGGLEADLTELVDVSIGLREMRRAVGVAGENMRKALVDTLSRDRNLAGHLELELDDAIVRLRLTRQRAAGILDIGTRPRRMPGTARRPALPTPGAKTSRPSAEPDATVSYRMGFAVDIVAYSKRSSPAKHAVQQRLAAVVNGVLDDMGIALSDTDHQGTGDGINVFLPQSSEMHRALPVLLRSCHERLARDNAASSDRIRLRLATAVGPMGLTALGFGGHTPVAMSRLLDSDVLRAAVTDHEDADVVALISGQLYADVVGEGYATLLPARLLERRSVTAKEFHDQAWLWVGK
ncbi:CATRA conflict system CASPASE/TPR repeat-associated protein [Streptomyces rubiginosohelvolus]|uniref:CATRA conflict system CASPASE/TPR repeat-associated protein n=1 Tax=Streptomyces sp. 021-4 TaxID=2789260 RepID=UPI0039F5208C